MSFPKDEVTVADELKRAGYHNMLVGKWHLGHSAGLRPEQRGFDEVLGFNLGASLYYPKGHQDVVNDQIGDFADNFLWANLRFFVTAANSSGSITFDPEQYMTGNNLLN